MSLDSLSRKHDLTPSLSSSTTISTQHSSSSHDDSSVDNIAAAGRFDLGLNKSAQVTKASAGKTASVAAASASATTGKVPTHSAQSAQSDQSSRPPVPQPVVTLIRGVACVFVGGGLFSAIYGGMKLIMPIDQGQDPQHGEHAALFVSGVVEMVVGLFIGMQTFNTTSPSTPPSHPA